MTKQKTGIADSQRDGTGSGSLPRGARPGAVGADLWAGPAAALPVLTPEQQSLVSANIGLVGVHLRNRVPTPRQPTRQREYEDLFQEGCVALARAASSYDASQHGSFAAYALPRIRGAIHAALYEYFTTIRVPTRACKNAKRDPSDDNNPALNGVQELTPEVARHLPAAIPVGDGGETTVSYTHLTLPTN